jgi:type IV secretion system protein VirB5
VTKHSSLGLACVALLLATSAPASATMPVIDVAAIGQLIEQILAWDEQLQGMKQQLSQLQQTHAALTGSRGMDQLLPQTAAQRNYLPTSLSSLASVFAPGAAIDPRIAQVARAQLNANAVLSPAEISRLAPPLQAALGIDRQAVAAAQALTQTAYARSSDRFSSLTTLIGQIGVAQDAKAIAELQGRIGAEQAMLANETIKLVALTQVGDADRAARDLARRESVLQNHGAFASRFQPAPPVP